MTAKTVAQHPADADAWRFRRVTDADCEVLSALAQRIWRQHYPGIISPEQVEYMLGLWYTPETLRQQAQMPQRLFLLAERQGADAGAEPLGYMATSEQAGYQFIHKLYVAEECRGQGLGAALLAQVPAALPQQLRVNKRNTSAIAFYTRQGFTVQAEDVLDIGHGYVMDDYLMVRKV